MEDIDELIRRYGLDEDREHIIIPLPGAGGTARRCFLLKRPMIRIVRPNGRYSDYPIRDVIEAIIRHPDVPLGETLPVIHEEMDADAAATIDTEKESL